MDTITYNAPTSTLLVGTRRWPARFVARESVDVSPMSLNVGWAPTMETRIHRVMFESGWDVSVIWGSMTYSDNYHHPAGDYRTDPRVVPPFNETPTTVEAAVIIPGDENDLLGEEPFGYLIAEELNRLLDLVASWSSGTRMTWDAVEAIIRPRELGA